MLQRILFVNSLDTDYLEDLTFAGLSEILGNEQVVSYPTNLHYYCSRYRYPKNIGQCRTAARFLIDRLALSSRLKSFEFDAVVLGSAKQDACEAFIGLAASLPGGIPKIFIDGGDRPEIGGDAIRENFSSTFNSLQRQTTFDLIFKRECLTTQKYDARVIPFPFSFKAPEFRTECETKKYDVAFWAVESHPVRTQALKIVESSFDCKANGTTTGQSFRRYNRHGARYLAELSAARIGYNFRGVGWDTLRYWELPGVGTLMISGKPEIRIPDNFVHGKQVVFCKDDLSDLHSLSAYYLEHDLEREEIARAGRNHLLQNHTYLHRARYFLDVCHDRLSAAVHRRKS